MLRPLARKRKPRPFPTKLAASSPNTRDSTRSSTLSMEPQHRFHCTGVWNEPELIARDGIKHSVQKPEGAVDCRSAMKGREAARKQLSHGSRTRDLHHFIPLAVLQNKNPTDLRFPRRCKRCLSVPRRSVHPQLSIALPQDNAVVAENFRIAQGLPEQCSCAFACAGVSQKQLPSGLSVHQSATVHLDANARGQIICDQKLVGGILERNNRPMFPQRLAAQKH